MTKKSFKKLLEEARKRDMYWVASVILDFTEELDKMMKAKGISRSDLARTLGVSPAYITKVLRGNVNFTVDSMVRLARVTGATVHIHLAPETQEVRIRSFSETKAKKSFRAGLKGLKRGLILQ